MEELMSVHILKPKVLLKMKNIIALSICLYLFSNLLSAQLSTVVNGVRPLGMVVEGNNIYLSEALEDRIIKVDNFQSNPIISTLVELSLIHI